MGPTLEKQQHCGQEKQTPWDFPTTSVRGDKDALESLGLWKAGLLSLFMETIQGWGGRCVYLKTVLPCHTANFNPIGNHTNCLHPALRWQYSLSESSCSKIEGILHQEANELSQCSQSQAPGSQLLDLWVTLPSASQSRLWVRSAQCVTSQQRFRIRPQRSAAVKTTWDAPGVHRIASPARFVKVGSCLAATASKYRIYRTQQSHNYPLFSYALCTSGGEPAPEAASWEC